MDEWTGWWSNNHESVILVFAVSQIITVTISDSPVCVFQCEPGQADDQRKHSSALLLPDRQQRVSQTAAERKSLNLHQ